MPAQPVSFFPSISPGSHFLGFSTTAKKSQKDISFCIFWIDFCGCFQGGVSDLQDSIASKAHTKKRHSSLLFDLASTKRLLNSAARSCSGHIHHPSTLHTQRSFSVSVFSIQFSVYMAFRRSAYHISTGATRICTFIHSPLWEHFISRIYTAGEQFSFSLIFFISPLILLFVLFLRLLFFIFSFIRFHGSQGKRSRLLSTSSAQSASRSLCFDLFPMSICFSLFPHHGWILERVHLHFGRANTGGPWFSFFSLFSLYYFITFYFHFHHLFTSLSSHILEEIGGNAQDIGARPFRLHSISPFLFFISLSTFIVFPRHIFPLV